MVKTRSGGSLSLLPMSLRIQARKIMIGHNTGLYL